MAKTPPIKLRIDIVEDHQFDGAGIGKKYQVIKWVFERKTGRTVEHGTFGTGYTYKEALALRAKIKRDYFG